MDNVLTDKDAVLSLHPTALAMMDADTGSYRIFHGDAKWSLWSLSASCPTELDAWRDAAQGLKKRSEA